MAKTKEELLADGWIERKHFLMKRGDFGTTILSKKHAVEKKEKKEVNINVSSYQKNKAFHIWNKHLSAKLKSPTNIPLNNRCLF